MNHLRDERRCHRRLKGSNRKGTIGEDVRKGGSSDNILLGDPLDCCWLFDGELYSSPPVFWISPAVYFISYQYMSHFEYGKIGVARTLRALVSLEAFLCNVHE